MSVFQSQLIIYKLIHGAAKGYIKGQRNKNKLVKKKSQQQ